MRRLLLTLVLLFSALRADAKPLKVGMAIPSYAHAVLWIAQEGGFFKKNGLEVEVFVLKGSAEAAKLAASGGMDVVLAGGDAVVKADLAGADLVAFAGLVNTFYHRLAAKKEVSKPEDLKGKAIGLPFLGGPQDMTARAALKKFGLAPEKDVQLRNMGAEFARLAAVTQGRVDAVTTDAPPAVLDGLGLGVVADVPSWKIPFPYMAAISSRKFLDSDPETAAKFLKALCEAMAFYRDDEKGSLALLAKVMPEERGTAADPAALYKANGPSRFTFPPKPDAAGFRTVLDFLDDANAAKKNPEDFIDNRVIEKLEKDGVFKRPG